MKKIIALAFILSSCMMHSCTYSITQVQTKGTAQDVVDDADSTSVTATANVPISGAEAATK
jgi:PBP1b-binding outer membrane lipoprotein LpoB